MKINIEVGDFGPYEPARVGNVYPIKGGRGLRYGHMQILIAITECLEPGYRGPAGLLLVVDKGGKPIGVNSYAMHYVDELQPIAFVDGIEEMSLTMRSLG